MPAASTIIPLTAIGSLALASAAAVNSWLKQRAARDSQLDDIGDTATQAASNQQEIERQAREIEHLSLIMVGRPKDDELGLPGVDGFVQEQTSINNRVRHDLDQIEQRLDAE